LSQRVFDGATAQEKDGMTEDEPRQDPELPRNARHSSLDERLSAARQAEAKRTGIAQPDANYRLGMRVLGELIGAPFGGAVIGLVLDRWLGTKPWLLLALLFLGLCVGIRNVIRISKMPMGPGPGAS
jgi:ATP synthase protein I